MQQEKENEEKEGITVKIRWRDCFKFWLAGLILALIPLLVVLLVAIAARA